MIPASLNTMLMDQPVSGGGFLPSTMSTIIGWWDANDISTITLSGSNVTAWADKTANANNLTVQDTAPNYTSVDAVANSKPSIGSNTTTGKVGMYSPLMTATDIYIVTYYNTGVETTFSTNQALFSSGFANGGFRVSGLSGTSNLSAVNAFSSTVSKNGAAASATILPLPLTVCKFVGSATTQIYRFGYNRVLDNNTWQGGLCEIVVCNGAPTSEEETNLLNYLYAKWGITP